jgi:rhomboid protease GluP
VVLQEEWYRIAVSMFLHGGLMHLGFDMVALVAMGQAIEGYFSGFDYLGIYFISGIVGAH